MRRTFLVAVGAAIGAAGLVGLAGTATAAEAGHNAWIKAPATAYQYPTTTSGTIFSNLQPGQQVTALCFTEGQNLGGNHNWFRISLTPDPQGTTGFVHRDAITVPDASLRHC